MLVPDHRTVALMVAWTLTACSSGETHDVSVDSADSPDTAEAVQDIHRTGTDDGSAPDTDASTASSPTICEALPALCTSVSVSEPTLGEMLVLAPSTSLPPQVTSQQAHNNLDATWWNGRLWFAFRTAPDHFASPETVLYVVSTADLTSWRFEGKFSLDTDLREPQLVAIAGELRFYFAVLGTSPLEFEPQGVRMTTWRGPGQWDPLQTVFDEGFIPWRIKEMLGETAVLGYTGGENVYDADGEPIVVQWLKTDDGVTFTPLIEGQDVILEGGSSETDAVILADGSLVAVSRNEAGDETGFGMKICRAPKDDLGQWTCTSDPRKYDSPLLFRKGETVYLIGRRNVTETGHYDLGQTDKPLSEQFISYQAAYWTNPKRCSLWTVDPAELTVEFVLDLPSKGDTCFPEIIPLTDSRVLVFNYTSPLDGDDDPQWVEGQTGPTLIYAVTLDLP